MNELFNSKTKHNNKTALKLIFIFVLDELFAFQINKYQFKLTFDLLGKLCWGFCKFLHRF